MTTPVEIDADIYRKDLARRRRERLFSSRISDISETYPENNWKVIRELLDEIDLRLQALERDN